MNKIDELLPDIDSSKIQKEAEEVIKELYDAIQESSKKLAKPRIEFIDTKSMMVHVDEDMTDGLNRIYDLSNRCLKSLYKKLKDYAKENAASLSPEIRKSLFDALDKADNAIEAREKQLSKVSSDIKNSGAEGKKSVETVKSVSGMLKNFGVEVPDFVNSALDGIGQVMDGIGSIDLTNPVSMIKGISTALVGLGNFVASMVDAGDYVKEKEIKEIQKEVDALSASYQNLQKEISKSHSTEKASFIEDANANLEHQKQLIEEQMSLEQEKKKTDDEKIKAYQQEIDSINKQIEANTIAMQEAMTGVSFDSFRQSFLNTLLDMDSNAEDFANNLEKYLQNAIFDSMIAKEFENRIAELYMNFSKKAADGFTEMEITDLRKEQEKLVKDMLEKRNELNETFGWGTQEDDGSQAPTAAKGIAQASQESVDELNGRMTAMQGHTYSLMENTRILVENSASVLERLGSIDTNTARLSYIEKDIRSVSACLSQMALHGVRVAV